MKYRFLLWLGLAWFSVNVGAEPAAQEAAQRAAGPDLARESRLKNQIIDAILDGEPIELEASGHRFLAIDMEPEDAPKGGVIVLHGRAFHPNWADVIQPLRTGLAERGWRTLSIQLPVLEKSAKYFDYLPLFPDAERRIQAAIEYLRSEGMERIVIAAHSCGAHMANHRFLVKGDAGIDAFVGIGMGATDYGQPMQEPFALDRLRVPVLDVYAEHDFRGVRRLAPERKAMLRSPQSRQIVVPNTQHYFVDQGAALTTTVGAWLDAL